MSRETQRGRERHTHTPITLRAPCTNSRMGGGGCWSSPLDSSRSSCSGRHLHSLLLWPYTSIHDIASVDMPPAVVERLLIVQPGQGLGKVFSSNQLTWISNPAGISKKRREVSDMAKLWWIFGFLVFRTLLSLVLGSFQSSIHPSVRPFIHPCNAWDGKSTGSPIITNAHGNSPSFALPPMLSPSPRPMSIYGRRPSPPHMFIPDLQTLTAKRLPEFEMQPWFRVEEAQNERAQSSRSR